VVVVVVPDDEQLDELSFLEQEMMVVAEKHKINNFIKYFSQYKSKILSLFYLKI
jgi:hypothetical protein